MQKLKLYYLHIDFGIKPFVQGLFDGGVQNWYLKVLDQERTNDLVQDQEQEIPATLIVINKIMYIIAMIDVMKNE